MKTWTLLSAMNDVHGVAECWLYIGQALIVANQADEASKRFTEARTAFNELGDHYFEALAVLGLGDAYACQEDQDAAVAAWNEALVLMPPTNVEARIIADRLAGAGMIAHEQVVAQTATS